MTEREAFIEAIAASPGDDTARLAFADWLQERGEEPRAEFIRLQCALALRSPPDERYEPAYSHYPTHANDEEARAAELLLNHWPEWFGPVLGAVGLPKPGSAIAPQQEQGFWRYPPYVMRTREWPLRHLPIAFEHEFSSRRRRRAQVPKRLLNFLRLDRGLVVGLNLSLANCTPRATLAAALRLEPIAALALRLSPDASQWAQLSHPSLARVRDLELTRTGMLSLANFFAEAGPLLNDPALSGVRSLALLSEHEFEPEFESPALLSHTEVEALLASAVARGLQSLRIGIEPDGGAAFSDTEPLPDLRALSLARSTVGRPTALSLHEYRNRLERLTLSGAFELGVLGRGRPWARLAELRLSGLLIGTAGCAMLAEPWVFPALTRLRIEEQRLDQTGTAGAIADALRKGQFPNLTALAVSAQITDNSLVVLAEGVVPTGIREVDLRGARGYTEAEYDYVRELLGDRVRLDPPSDLNDPIPF